MIDSSSTAVDDELPPGSRRVVAVDPIEGEDRMINLTAMYRHFRPSHEQCDLHTFRFRYTVSDTGAYLPGLAEWCPPDRTVCHAYQPVCPVFGTGDGEISHQQAVHE